MKLPTFGFIYTALITSIIAQPSTPYYDIQSPPFRLVLKSDNATLNYHLLGACHQGAAIEGLCLTTSTPDSPSSSYTTFTHNISSSSLPANSTLNNTSTAPNTPGILTYTLLIAGNISVPSAMALSTSPGSNLANPLFSPGWQGAQVVSFDEEGGMYISVWQDDTVSPPGVVVGGRRLVNWWVCWTRVGYLYQALVWKMGVEGRPQNPSCVGVGVGRVWV